MFHAFPIFLLLMTSSEFIISIVGQIRISQRWVWQIWVWIGVLWYILFLSFFFAWWRVHCWCFCVWSFHINRNWIQMWSTHFNIFAFALKFRIFVPNLKISSKVFLSIVCQCVSKVCSFSYIMLRRSPMGDIQSPSNFGSGDPYPTVLIQCVNGREPMYH